MENEGLETAGTDEALQGESGANEGESTFVESGTETGESSTESLDANGEPSAEEGLFDGMTAQQLHDSYKNLQSELGKRSESMKGMEDKFNRYGGAESILEWAQYLNENSRFADWVNQEQSRNAIGIDESNLDDGTKAALDMVEKLANSVADRKVQEAIKQYVEPLMNQAKQSTVTEHFKAMDTQYGSEWRDLQDDMMALSDQLPPEIADNPSYEDIEDLYWRASRKAGKFETNAAKFYEKQLKAKQSKASGSPNRGAAPSQPKGAPSIREAFAIAKEQHGFAG